MTNERWLDIPEYYGLYQVSNLGRIKCLEKSHELTVKGTKCTRVYKEIIRKTNKDKKTKYIRITLTKDGKSRFHYVHRIVAKTFMANPEHKTDVNHKNGVRHDNRVENLEWCTPSENHQHSFDYLGRKPWNKGMRKKRIKSCPICKEEFNAKRNKQMFCGNSCSSKHKAQKRYLKQEGLV